MFSWTGFNLGEDKEKMVQDDRDVDMRLSPPMMKVFQRQRLIIHQPKVNMIMNVKKIGKEEFKL